MLGNALIVELYLFFFSFFSEFVEIFFLSPPLLKVIAHLIWSQHSCVLTHLLAR